MEDSPCCEVPHLEVIPVEEDLYGVDWTWRKRCVEDRVVGSPAVFPQKLDLLELGRREVWGEGRIHLVDDQVRGVAADQRPLAAVR